MNKIMIMAELNEILDLAEQSENIYLFHKVERVITSLRDTWDRDEFYYDELISSLKD
jgi:hypothetical protein